LIMREKALFIATIGSAFALIGQGFFFE